MVSEKISLAFIQETWLTDLNNHTTATIKAYGYDIHHFYRDRTGGGVAILYNPAIKIVKLFIENGSTFESISIKIKLPSGKYLLCSCVYRTGSLVSFFYELDIFLGTLFSMFQELLICGDFNIHMDEFLTDCSELNEIIGSYGLYQLVDKPTHKAGHILDLVLTSHNIVKNNEIVVLPLTSEFPTCDHSRLLFTLNCDVLPLIDKKKISFRNLLAINQQSFNRDLVACTEEVVQNCELFESAVQRYNTNISETLDKHAPTLYKWIKEVPDAKWFDSGYKGFRQRRRKAEKIWKKTGLPEDRFVFESLRKRCNELADLKKKQYFKHHFEKYKYSQNSLYKFVDIFLDNENSLTLPPSECLQNSVNEFNSFFSSKIENIRKSFAEYQDESFKDYVEFEGQQLDSFELTTCGEIEEILKDTTIKSCDLDPIPASLVKDNLDVLIPVLCDLVNLSLSTGSVEGTKSAYLTPLIKGSSLDINNLKNYRPVSNLCFVGKIIEKVVLKRLNEHLTKNNLNIDHQSAYKKGFSTETLLIRVVNDLLIASDENKATVVMLLDLSAAFDTVDHKKLLDILRVEIGITGTAWKWFQSYLSGRCQRVKIGGFQSFEILIKFGVPQGSVLGPILFNIYIRSLYNNVQDFMFNIFGFADDHQVFKSFDLKSEYQTMTVDLPKCFQSITSWMTKHFLLLNPGKTEIIVFGNQTVLSKLELHGVFIMPGVCVRTVSTAKNLGFHLDASLNFSYQVRKLKISCFRKLRNIAKMKPYLSIAQMQQLVQALVISSIDYCNALYLGTNSSVIKQLQNIQNRACAIVLGLKRKESKSKHLESLHWLKVPERIEFKILLTVFKALNGLAPSYITQLLLYNDISGSRTPSLRPYQAKTAIGNRAFVCQAARLWNNLPLELKTYSNVDNFKSELKTFLFKRCYKTV